MLSSIFKTMEQVKPSAPVLPAMIEEDEFDVDGGKTINCTLTCLASCQITCTYTLS